MADTKTREAQNPEQQGTTQADRERDTYSVADKPPLPLSNTTRSSV